MSLGESTPDFNRGAVRPVECFRSGWQLIKDDYWLYFGITFVGMLIGGVVPFGILLGPMWCGIDICLLRRLRGQRVTFNNLFEGFNYFTPSLIATLIMIVPIIVGVLVMYGLMVVGMIALVAPQAPQGGAPPNPAFFATMFGIIFLYVVGLILISAVLGAPFIFMYALIVDRKLSGTAALGTSIKAILGNFGGVMGLVLLNSLLSLVGMMVCCVGAYFLIPITFAAYTIAYRQVFPAEERRMVDDAEWEEPADPDRGGDLPRTEIRE